jgi:hypothetical protein
MPLLDTQGNDSADAYGGGAAAVPNYIENLFNTYVFQSVNGAQTINTGVDVSTYGGMLFYKFRDVSGDGRINDTVRGVGTGNTKNIYPNNTSAEDTGSVVTSANTNGWTLNTSGYGTYNLVSWTFRKQPKFFDIVTYTGNGSTQTLSHNLGSVPACIIVKNASDTSNWATYHKGYSVYGGTGNIIQILNGTNAAFFSTAFNNTMPTSTNFQVGLASGTNATNVSGNTYVAYLFASNAGGFGLTGTDNVITCDYYTGNGSATGPVINLGYEPQWLMIKSVSDGNWQIIDNMRGMTVGTTVDATLQANLSAAESSVNYVSPTATGFQLTSSSVQVNDTSVPYIYIAIRRGPMAVPTAGTSVFSPVASSATTGTITSGFPTDMVLSFDRTTGLSSYNRMLQDRLRGNGVILDTSAPLAEYSNSSTASFGSNTGIVLNGGSVYSNGFVHEQFRRAPSFFDEVCYSGNGVVGQTYTHNLTVTPEIILIKVRNTSRDWILGTPSIGWTKYLQINQTDAPLVDSDIWNNTSPTSSVFTLGSNIRTNASGYNYVAYLFATCAGVSKVGTYTGNGGTQAISCGFTSGARFVLLRKTNTTGNWFIYDTARGMSTLTDPYLFTNTTAAEVATLGSVTTTTGGFTLNESILTGINTSGGSYIFLAIA